MKRITLFVILALSLLKCYGQDDLLDEVTNALYALNFEGNIDGIRQLYPSLEAECKATDNDTIRYLFAGLKGTLLFADEKYDEAFPILEEEVKWKEKHAVTRYNYLEDVYRLAQCYIIKEDVREAENCLRRAIVNWTDESGLVTMSASSGNIDSFTEEYRVQLFLAGYYITDIFQLLAQIYLNNEEYTLIPHCYIQAQNNAAIMYEKDDDRYYENIILLIKYYTDIEDYSNAMKSMIDYRSIPENLESHEEIRKLQEELQKHIDNKND